MASIKQIIILFLNGIITKRVFLALLLKAISALPTLPVTNREKYPKIVKLYHKLISVLRHSLNRLPASERQFLSDTYLIPVVNRLFDKNYVNMAQLTLLALEEYFLSKKTDKDFEEVLSRYSSHAVAAGERFRRKYPLPIAPAQQNTSKTIGFVAHFVAISGYEIVLGLGPHFKRYAPKMFALRVFDLLNGPFCADLFKENGIEFNIPKTAEPWGHDYDVFTLRQMLIDNPVDIALWPLPPFHMYFFFSFGLAHKQVWFSQYLRPNIEFKYLDEVLTPGGAGQVHKKMFNGREWDIIPQVAYIPGISDREKKPGRKYLFTPARLEKLKQPEFMQCVAEILKRDPDTHFKWTGYYLDKEVQQFFDGQGLKGRHTYLPWLEQQGLLHEIESSDVILACFPLSLGTVENMAAHFRVPVISLYDEECNHYWRDVYWEALRGNKDLQAICMDERGNSKIIIAKTTAEYIETALRVLSDKNLAKLYGDVYHDSYEYTYGHNPNDIGGAFGKFVDGLYRAEKE